MNLCVVSSRCKWILVEVAKLIYPSRCNSVTLTFTDAHNHLFRRQEILVSLRAVDEIFLPAGKRGEERERERAFFFFFFANSRLRSSVGNVIDSFLIRQTCSWVAERMQLKGEVACACADAPVLHRCRPVSCMHFSCLLQWCMKRVTGWIWPGIHNVSLWVLCMCTL